jgi:hypothetical protein
MLQRLAQHLQHLALELGQLVQEQHPVMRQAHLSRPGNGAAADEAGIGEGVVRGAEGAGGDEGGVGGRSPLMEWICFVSRSPTIVVRPPPTARKSQFVAIPDKKVPGALWEWTCDLDELDFLDEDSVCDFRPG